MNILLIGGTGFIGRHLVGFFVSKGFGVAVIGLRKERPSFLDASAEYISADTTKWGDWANRVRDSDVIVNLVGVSIAQRWNRKIKEAIRESRIKTTRNVVEALYPDKSTVLINASAIGYYGDCGDRKVTEEDPPGNDFLANLCRDWEREAFRGKDKAKVIVARFGVVLGRNGGALSRMVLPFRLGLGSTMGSGEQWLSWIHISDLVRAIYFLIEKEYLQGPFNFCSPYPERNKDFTRVLSDVLKRPASLRIPSLVLKIMLGEMGDSLLTSCRCIPERLLKAGFHFQFAVLKEALSNILGGAYL